MKLLVILILASAALLFLGRQTKKNMSRGSGETEIAIHKIRQERRKRHGD